MPKHLIHSSTLKKSRRCKMPETHRDVVPGGCLCPPYSRQCVSGRSVTRGRTASRPCPYTAHLPWLPHAPVNQAATPHAWKKAPGRMGTSGKKRAGKSPQALAASAGTEGSEEHPTLCPTAWGQVVPCRAPGCQTGLSQTVPRLAMPRWAEQSHAMLSRALLSHASPGWAERSHAKPGPC